MRTRDERKNEGIKRDEAELSATFHKFVPGLGSILQRASYFHGLFFPIEKPIDREERFHGPHRDRLTWRCSESVLFRGYNRGFEILRGQEFELGKKRAVIFRGTSDPFHARPTLSADPQAGKNSRVRFDSSRSIVVRIAFNMERCGLFSCSPERIYFFPERQMILRQKISSVFETNFHREKRRKSWIEFGHFIYYRNFYHCRFYFFISFTFNEYSNDILSIIFLENSLSIERYSLSRVKLGSKYPLRGTIT